MDKIEILCPSCGASVFAPDASASDFNRVHVVPPMTALTCSECGFSFSSKTAESPSSVWSFVVIIFALFVFPAAIVVWMVLR